MSVDSQTITSERDELIKEKIDGCFDSDSAVLALTESIATKAKLNDMRSILEITVARVIGYGLG